MGGKKKLGLKQMERMQEKRDKEDKAKDKKERGGSLREKRTIGVIPPDVKNEKIVSEVRKMNVLTPYVVASRFNIRLSAAKDFLEQMEQIGAVQLISGSHKIRIYKSVAA